MSWIKDVLRAVGLVVDKAVPVSVGDRTKWSVVGCMALSVGKVFVPADFQPVVDAVQGALCAGVPAFALAGVVRGLK